MNYDLAVNFSGKRLYVAITGKHNTLELPGNYYINYGAERIRIKQELGFVKIVLKNLPLCPSTGVLRKAIDGYIVEYIGIPSVMFVENLQLDNRIVVGVILLVLIIVVFIVFAV